MKSRFQLAGVAEMLLPVCFGLIVLTGCKSLETTSFAPLDAKLEPADNGGAEYIVVINTSGQTLHNYRFSGQIQEGHAFIYLGNDPVSNLPSRLSTTTYVFMSSGAELKPGQEIRFRRNFGFGPEGSILYPVSQVQIGGECDEGRFRESWQVVASSQPRR